MTVAEKWHPIRLNQNAHNNTDAERTLIILNSGDLSLHLCQEHDHREKEVLCAVIKCRT